MTSSRQYGNGDSVKRNEDSIGIPNAKGSNGTATFKEKLRQFRHDEDESGSRKSTRRHDAASNPQNTTRKRTLAETHDNNTTTSPSKKPRPSTRYAPPTKYAHLPHLTDILAPNLIALFVGFNPGVRTSQAGHAYAHPSNHFWKLLHASGCTDERLRPEQDVDLPRLYGLGNTNIVERVSRDAGELSKKEMAAGTPVLEEKVRVWRPAAVCIVGKGIWEAVWRWRYGREIRKGEFRYGWQDDSERMGKDEEGGWEGARVFVATATSGLSASTSPAEKEAIWRPFGEWVAERRGEREGEGIQV